MVNKFILFMFGLNSLCTYVVLYPIEINGVRESMALILCLLSYLLLSVVMLTAVRVQVKVERHNGDKWNTIYSGPLTKGINEFIETYKENGSFPYRITK